MSRFFLFYRTVFTIIRDLPITVLKSCSFSLSLCLLRELAIQMPRGNPNGYYYSTHDVGFIRNLMILFLLLAMRERDTS